MKTRAFAVYLLIFTLANLTALSRQVSGAVGTADRVALVGATVINPADGKVMPNATVVINGDKIERVAMGKQDAAALGKQRKLFAADKGAALKLLKVGDSPRNEKLDATEHAALATTCLMMLNLDEALNK